MYRCNNLLQITKAARLIDLKSINLIYLIVIGIHSLLLKMIKKKKKLLF